MIPDEPIREDDGGGAASSNGSEHVTEPRPGGEAEMGPTVRSIGRVSALLGGISVVLLALIMLAETVSRYLFNHPLGWNVSLVENLLMPTSVFIALPWLYVCAGHVSAGLVYTRMSSRLQFGARILAFCIGLAMAALLFGTGLAATWDSFVLNEIPSPVSSDMPLPNWVWLSVQPLGAGGLLVVMIMDARRFLRFGEPESEVES
jgi:TRAP-type C4-dicarboxylate transport system permease small subunit